MAVYFVTDFHLGIPTQEDSHERELKLLRFLDSIKADCEELFLMGDLFDFWYEYKSVVPKGFVRIQGKLAEFTDAGIPVHLFIARSHRVNTSPPCSPPKASARKSQTISHAIIRMCST